MSIPIFIALGELQNYFVGLKLEWQWMYKLIRIIYHSYNPVCVILNKVCAPIYSNLIFNLGTIYFLLPLFWVVGSLLVVCFFLSAIIFGIVLPNHFLAYCFIKAILHIFWLVIVLDISILCKNTFSYWLSWIFKIYNHMIYK